MRSTVEDSDAIGDVNSAHQHLPPFKPKAIVTLLTTNDFLPGVQTLLYSIKETSLSTATPKNTTPDPAIPSSVPPSPPVDLVVLATPNISRASRESLHPTLCTRIIEVEPIPYPNPFGESDGKKSSHHVPAWDVNCGLTKLRIFDLEEYDRILYVDADCLVVKDIGHLLHGTEHRSDDPSRGLLAAAPDLFPPDRFNAGVLLIQPSSKIFSDIMEQSKTLVSYDGGDTGFLNAYYPDWYASGGRLSFGYNAQRFMHRCTYGKQPLYWDLAVKGGKAGRQDRLKIIHYSSSPKPWETLKPSGHAGVVGGSGHTRVITAGGTKLREHLDNATASSLVEINRGKHELEDLWWEWHERTEEYADQCQGDEGKKECDLTSKSSARRQSDHAKQCVEPSCDSYIEADASVGNSKGSKGTTGDVHKLVARRFRELRKVQGLSPKDAMDTARKECAGTERKKEDDVDAGTAVARMFGMPI